MNLTQFEPWTIAELMHRDLDLFSGRRLGRSSHGKPVADWVPAVDIIEEKDRFVLRADVPGVAPGDIDISMDGGVLTVSGERHGDEAAEGRDVRRAERSSGRFYRRFTLPDAADTDSITAKSRDGILEVAIPKQPEVQARRISVEAV